MRFRRTTVSVDGEAFHLRELDAAAVDALERAHGEYGQALVLITLSLTDAEGTPTYSTATLEDGLAMVRALPARVLRDHLIPAATRLNAETLDDARGN